MLVLILIMIQGLCQEIEPAKDAENTSKNEFYSHDNLKIFIVLLCVAGLIRYCYQKKILLKIGEVIISLKNLHGRDNNQTDYQQSKFKGIYKYFRNIYRKTWDCIKRQKQTDIKQTYSQFDIEDAI